MRIISQGKTSVRKILGTQKPKNCICRKMRYVVEAQDGKDLLLLNTVTGELARLDEAEAAAWQALTGTVPESLEELYKRHYLVPEGYDERKIVEQIRAVLRLTKKPGEITSFIILPTTACNARCFYCYESDYPHHTMTEETAEAAARFMIKSCGSKRKVKIQWFGGEPLVGRNRIAQICRILQEEEIELSSQMTT
ncbi:MAG: radical SAM protein, partial [Lachnospiraceae bacterium]